MLYVYIVILLLVVSSKGITIMKKEKVIGKYSSNGKKCIVDGFNVYADTYSEKDYQKYWRNVSSKILFNDYLDVTIDNKLLPLLVDNTIDRPLYKALYLISSYSINQNDISNCRSITDRMRYRSLRNNFKLWYNRSKHKLPYKLMKKLIKLMKDKAKISIYDNIDKFVTNVSNKYKLSYSV